MNIILIGCGKVGTALIRQLSAENHNITVIDTNAAKIQQITEELDILGIVGDGTSINILTEAGMENADIVIAVTGSDELNLLCCMFAKSQDIAAPSPVSAILSTTMKSNSSSSNWASPRLSTPNWQPHRKFPDCCNFRQPAKSIPSLKAASN